MELSGLSNALTSYPSFRTVAVSSSNIETLLLEHSGDLYLLAANKSSSPVGNVTFTIAGLPLSSVTECFDGRKISISSNRFTDSGSRSDGGFGAYQVHVYQIH